MSNWKLYRWTWILDSPLHLGTTPAGILDRTRLYVPARTLWGAVTAEIARKQSNKFPDYKDIGEKLLENVRFSYLFPAKKVGDQWHPWLPKYVNGQGLIWCSSTGNQIEDRKFRSWLLYTRPATAISPSNEVAEEGTLREHEILLPYSRWGKDTIEKVGLTGYVFIKQQNEANQIKNELSDLTKIFVGGDIRYGQGWLSQEKPLVDVEITKNAFFGYEVNTENPDCPEIITSHLLAHTLINKDSILINGNLEAFSGRNMLQEQNSLSASEHVWVPGSSLSMSHNFSIEKQGIWKLK